MSDVPTHYYPEDPDESSGGSNGGKPWSCSQQLGCLLVLLIILALSILGLHWAYVHYWGVITAHPTAVGIGCIVLMFVLTLKSLK